MSRPMQQIDGLSPCPAWCHTGLAEHYQALSEGCEVEDITHRSVEPTLRLDKLTNAKTGHVLRGDAADIGVQLLQPGQPLPFGGFPVINVETHKWDNLR